jgi:hypothetical protein
MWTVTAEPLSPMAPRKRPALSGDSTWYDTLIDPALSPKIVT